MGKEGISLEAFNIHFCPVNQGHQSHSIVERAVRRMKEAIGSMDLRLLRAGAIETFNFLLICEDELNNIPLGVKRAGSRGDTKTISVLCSLYGSKNSLLVICLVHPAPIYMYVLLENKSEYRPLGLMVLSLAFLSFLDLPKI